MNAKNIIVLFGRRLSRIARRTLFLLLVIVFFFIALMLMPMFQGDQALLRKVNNTQDYRLIEERAVRRLQKSGESRAGNGVIYLNPFVDIEVRLTAYRRKKVQEIDGEEFSRVEDEIEDEHASPQLRYDNIILFSGIVLIICLIVFTFSSEKSEHVLAANLQKSKIDASIGDSAPSITTVDGILQVGMIGAQHRAEAMFSRSTLLLAGGIIMAFIGVAIFYISLPNLTPNEPASNYLPKAIRPTGVLIFIESIAWFLLRQYRALIEDYKAFHLVYLKRANFLAAYKLVSGNKVRPEDLFMAASLIDEDITGRLKQGETTEASEHARGEEASPVFDLVETLIKHGLGK